LKALFGQPSFLALLSYFCLFALANWGINGWLPTYLREHFKLGLGAAGLSATGYIQLASFVGVLIGGSAVFGPTAGCGAIRAAASTCL